MKIRNLTLAAVVSAGLIATQAFGAGSAQAMDSRAGVGVLKSQDGGATEKHVVGSSNGGVWKTLDGGSSWRPGDAEEGSASYVGSANGGVWKTTGAGAPAMTLDGVPVEPSGLLVPAIQKPHCASKYC